MSKRPSSDVTCTLAGVTIAARSALFVATAFPMCRSMRCVPVTNHPPQRISNGIRWSVVYAGPYIVVPSTPGKTLPTDMPHNGHLFRTSLAGNAVTWQCMDDAGYSAAMWAGSDGESLGHVRFGSKTSVYYREQIEFPFFRHNLKDAPDPKLPEATMFETKPLECWGAGEGRYECWCLSQVSQGSFYVDAPDSAGACDAAAHYALR